LSQHILIVDDDLAITYSLYNLLKGLGYKIHMANRGEEALEITAEVKPDLILLDIHMPEGMDGIEICRRLKDNQDSSFIPVIFLTEEKHEESLVKAFDAGAADYVVKPFKNRVLLARVRTHIQLGMLSRNLEETLTERTRELHQANRQLRRLAREMTLVEEREKRRLAGDLHDSPMQKLALAQMRIESACPSANIDNNTSSGLELLREALQELRLLQFELSPPILYQSGLAAALKWLATHATKRWEVEFSFSNPGSMPKLKQEFSIVLFQFARELVTNVVKHSAATRGEIRLEHQASKIFLTVADNGRGFASSPTADTSQRYDGFGLFSLRERVNLLGGKLRINSGRGGSRARIKVPITPSRRTGDADTDKQL